MHDQQSVGSALILELLYALRLDAENSGMRNQSLGLVARDQRATDVPQAGVGNRSVFVELGAGRRPTARSRHGYARAIA